MSTAAVYGGWEFHTVNGTLFITSEAEPDIQVALSPEAVKGLVEYINRIPEGMSRERLKS